MRRQPGKRSAPPLEGTLEDTLEDTLEGTAEPATALILRKSPGRLKLDAQEKAHERLLRDIDKKRLSCETTEQLLRDVQDKLHIETAPLRAKLSSSVREIDQIFSELLSRKSRFDRSERAELRRFYQHVLGSVPRPDVSEEDAEEPAGARAGNAGASAPFDPGWAGAAHEPEHASAAKPSEKNTGLLRALYRKLAIALHPDRARDPSETARLTSVMKQVTRAYADQDLAKLVELDRSWLAQSTASDVDDELERRAAQLFETNRELRRQLRALSARLSELERSLPGTFGLKGKRLASGAEIAASILGELERELKDLERVRDAARDLLQGRIGVLEFLMGPRAAADAERDPLNDLFEEMLEEMLVASARSGPRRSRRR